MTQRSRRTLDSGSGSRVGELLNSLPVPGSESGRSTEGPVTCGHSTDAYRGGVFPTPPTRPSLGSRRPLRCSWNLLVPGACTGGREEVRADSHSPWWVRCPRPCPRLPSGSGRGRRTDETSGVPTATVCDRGPSCGGSPRVLVWRGPRGRPRRGRVTGVAGALGVGRGVHVRGG